MNKLITLILVVFSSGCVVISPPFTVVGKYQTTSNSCQLTLRGENNGDQFKTSYTIENCNYNVGDVIK